VADYDETCGTPAALLELARRLDRWRPDQVGTLMFVREGDRVLLIHKLRGHGAGKLNGPGGKTEPGETPQRCAVRETEEEVGIRAVDPALGAVLRFVDSDAQDWLGYVFVAHRFEGTVRDSREALPVWWPVDTLPFDEMWDDDRYWLPRILAGERLEGDFLFRDGVLAAHRLRTLSPRHGRPASGIES
jgi:8-oxo-dGTP diphosphatase